MSIDFTGVKSLTIPEGIVTKVVRKTDGSILWEQTNKVQIGNLEVGSVIQLNVDGVATNFIIAHQGSLSQDYDNSCTGTWLLMEDSYTSMAWDSSNNDYENSDIHSYLNSTFLNLFDSDVQSAIKEVKIPYTKGVGSYGGTLKTGSDGLSTKIFLLSYAEYGYSTSSSVNFEGKALGGVEYFNEAVENAWLRSPVIGEYSKAWAAFSATTASATVNNVTYSRNVRPAMIMPSEFLVSSNN